MHIFGSNNMVLSSNLSLITGTENTQHRLDNIKIPITDKVFRTISGDTTSEILIDTLTIKEIDTFMVVGSASEGLGITSMSIYGSITTDFSSSTEIPIDLSMQYNFGFKQFDPSTFRYWKIVITGSDYCELSNIYLGKADILSTNAIALGSFKYEETENATIKKSTYGNKFITKRNSVKMLSGDINLLNNTEQDTLNEIYSYHRSTTPLWFITCPADEIGVNAKYKFSGFFYLRNKISFTNSHYGLWDTSIVLEEVI